MELREVMRTNGAVRTFRADPIPTDTLYRVLDIARFAPSGGNLQGWHVTIVRDKVRRRQLADLSNIAWNRYLAEGAAGYRGFSVVERAPSDVEVPPDLPVHPLLAGIEQVPEVLVVTVDLRVLAVIDRDLARPSIIGGASIYPFIENILLAARDEGLGSVLTTFLAAQEPEAASALGLPPEQAIAAMIALGVPDHRATRLKRRSVETFATLETFDGEAFTKGS